MILLENRRARHDYQFVKTYTAGLVLLGGEVKSLRQKSGSFFGAYVKVIGDEAFLLNMQVTPYQFADNRKTDPKRTRKLLMKKREIAELKEYDGTKGMTIIPLAIESVGRHIKLKLAAAKGLQQFERRAELRRRATERDLQQDLKRQVRLK